MSKMNNSNKLEAELQTKLVTALQFNELLLD